MRSQHSAQCAVQRSCTWSAIHACSARLPSGMYADNAVRAWQWDSEQANWPALTSPFGHNDEHLLATMPPRASYQKRT